MNSKEHHPVQSPYVVVLGGNSVRRKSTPPPDAPGQHDERSDHQVYGVLPPIKTVSADAATVERSHHATGEGTKPRTKRKWWNLRTSSAPKESQEETTSTRIIDIPTEREQATSNSHRGKFLRGIAKKGYLTSKLAVELPLHAKIGGGIALLILVVGLPVVSRFIDKPTPITAGTVVAIGTDALVAQVGRSVDLPTGETPLVVLATADDIRRLNVPDSKPGNKVLLYQKAGKIVVYDAESDTVLGVVNRSQP